MSMMTISKKQKMIKSNDESNDDDMVGGGDVGGDCRVLQHGTKAGPIACSERYRSEYCSEKLE